MQEWHHYDPVENVEHYHTKEDVAPVIELAKDMSYLQPSKEWRHAACVPVFAWEQSLRERWGRDDWKKWVNNHDNKPFRTWPGEF